MSKLYSFLFSQENRAKLERLTVILAIAGFFAHLVLILAAQIWPLELFGGQLLQNPINAIYTPFSFILIFEIYLLIFYLPRSFSTSLLKQFEVISLIMVRRVFGDITNINFAEIEISDPGFIKLVIDLGAVLIMALAILLFIKAKNKLKAYGQPDMDPGEQRFNSLKRQVSAILLVILGGISLLHLLCQSNSCLTQTKYPQIEPIAFDYGHLTGSGSIKASSLIFNNVNLGQSDV